MYHIGRNNCNIYPLTISLYTFISLGLFNHAYNIYFMVSKYEDLKSNQVVFKDNWLTWSFRSAILT